MFYQKTQKAGEKNLISLAGNGAAPKYDIRDWSPDMKDGVKGM